MDDEVCRRWDICGDIPQIAADLRAEMKSRTITAAMVRRFLRENGRLPAAKNTCYVAGAITP